MKSREGGYEDAINSSCLVYVVCTCLRIVVSKSYCVVYLTCAFVVLGALCCQFPCVVHFLIVPSVFYDVNFLHSTSPVTDRRCSIISCLSAYIITLESLTMDHIRRRLVRVTPSLVLCVMFCRSLFVFLSIFFCHCVLCPSIYIVWLPLWYLQTLLVYC
jgi:hypothetical protein